MLYIGLEKVKVLYMDLSPLFRLGIRNFKNYRFRILIEVEDLKYGQK